MAITVHVPSVAICLVALIGVGLTSTLVVKEYVSCVKTKGASTDVGIVSGCGQNRELVWAIALEALVMVSFLIVALFGAVQRVHFGLMGFLVMSGVLMAKRAQDCLRGETLLDVEDSYVAAGGFVLLAVLNSVLVIWVGVSRAKGSGGMRPGTRVYSVPRFAVLLLLAFATIIGAFMVAGSARREQLRCADSKGCEEASLELGMKWFGAAFAVFVLFILAVCEGVGILEGFGNTLAAFVAAAGVLVMDQVDYGLDEQLASSRGVVQNIQIAGFITLAVVCLALILILGYLNGSRRQGEEVQTSTLGVAVKAAYNYSLLPLVLGWTLVLSGLLEDNIGSNFHLTYWTLAFEAASVILATFAKHCEYGALKVPSILFMVMVTINLIGRAELLMSGNSKFLSLAAGGMILMTAINFILIILLGWEEEGTGWSGFRPLLETST